MLAIHYIRENEAQVVKELEKRGLSQAAAEVANVISIDKDRRALQTTLDAVAAEMKQVSAAIGQAVKAGNTAAVTTAKEQTGTLKTHIKELTQELRAKEARLKDALSSLPNLPYDEVAEGQSAEDNEVIFQSTETTPTTPLPHWDLVKQYDIIDFEAGNKLTGAGFPVYRDQGARLQRALINFFLDAAVQAGYIEIQPPTLVNATSAYSTGQLPDKEGQMYQLVNEDLYLIPTAEVPLTNLYRQQILKESELPIKNVGYTSCFRREAGSWGSHVRGLNRLHQFDKVEIVQITQPEKAKEAFEEMCQHVQKLLAQLELPYRVLRLCSGDLGFTAALTHDMEVWSSGQNRWLEVSSVSRFDTYQANRLQLRYKDATNKIHLLHTLNGSASALPRIMAALLENNQTPQGILIPAVLQPYTGFDCITAAR